MSDERDDRTQPEDSSVPEGTIINIGTEPVGETHLPRIGTDVVIGSEMPRGDEIHLVGPDHFDSVSNSSEGRRDHRDGES
jgi:hypothetical protein